MTVDVVAILVGNQVCLMVKLSLPQYFQYLYLYLYVC